MNAYQLAAAAVLLAGAANATPPKSNSVPFTVSYEGEAPGVEHTTATFDTIGVETFNEIKPGSGNDFTTDFGTGGVIKGVYQDVRINSADQYGGAGGAGNYPVAFTDSPYELDLTSTNGKNGSGVNYFGYWLSALDAGNLVTFYSKGAELFQFRPQDVIDAVNATATPSEYYGNPNANFKGQDGGEPFIFLNFFDNAGTFDKIVFQENNNGGGYESDNHTVGYNVINPGQGTTVPLNASNNPPVATPTIPAGTLVAGVPEPASWALMMIGVGGMGAMLRRRTAAVRTAA